MKLILDLHELDKKPKAISTIVFKAFEKREIPKSKVLFWWTQHRIEWLMARFWWLEWKMETNPVRSPVAYITRIIDKKYPLPEEFIYWKESKKRQILADNKTSDDLKRLVSL